jgi:hypothetical protein
VFLSERERENEGRAYEGRVAVRFWLNSVICVVYHEFDAMGYVLNPPSTRHVPMSICAVLFFESLPESCRLFCDHITLFCSSFTLSNLSNQIPATIEDIFCQIHIFYSSDHHLILGQTHLNRIVIFYPENSFAPV